MNFDAERIIAALSKLDELHPVTELDIGALVQQATEAQLEAE